MERPILFNTSMVRAIQEGRKTVTRRAIRPQPDGRPIRMTENSCYPGCYAIEGHAEGNSATMPDWRHSVGEGDVGSASGQPWRAFQAKRRVLLPGGRGYTAGTVQEQWLASCYSYAKGGSPDFPAGRRRAGGAAEGSYMGKCGRRRVRKSYAIR